MREVAGPPGTAAVVLLHGWTVTADVSWFPTYGPLGRHHRVIAPDLRGHGRGVRPADGRVTLDDTADDVAVLLDGLGIDRAIVIGYSMGGAVAQVLWRRHQERVRGLVLCSTATGFGGWPGSDVWFRGQTAVARVLRASPGVGQWAMARAVNGKVDQGRYAAWIRAELLRSDPALLLSAGASIGGFDARPWIGEVDVPTAVIVTTADAKVPPGRQRALAAAIPGAGVWEVDSPHNASVTAPDRWVPVLLDAVAAVAGAPGRPQEPD